MNGSSRRPVNCAQIDPLFVQPSSKYRPEVAEEEWSEIWREGGSKLRREEAEITSKAEAEILLILMPLLILPASPNLECFSSITDQSDFLQPDYSMKTEKDRHECDSECSNATSLSPVLCSVKLPEKYATVLVQFKGLRIWFSNSSFLDHLKSIFSTQEKEH